MKQNPRVNRELERLRQEREVFDQKKIQAMSWFRLRLRIGYVSILLILIITTCCVVVVFDSGTYHELMVRLAGGALFVNLLGLIVVAWKILLKPNSMSKLSPETDQPRLKEKRSPERR